MSPKADQCRTVTDSTFKALAIKAKQIRRHDKTVKMALRKL